MVYQVTWCSSSVKALECRLSGGKVVARAVLRYTPKRHVMRDSFVRPALPMSQAGEEIERLSSKTFKSDGTGAAS